MKTSMLVVFAGAIVFLLLAAGCTQTVQPTPTPTPLPTTIPTPTQTAVLTTVPTTRVPLPTMTAPALPLPESIRDTQLLFTVSAPDGYSGATIRVPTSDYNILYKTTLFRPGTSGANSTIINNRNTYIPLADSLVIFSYSSSLSVDQNIRNIIRNSGAVFNESAVTYNAIRYIRFDARSDPYSGTPAETIIFVGNKASANERGFLPVIMYTITPDDTVSPATYENMVKSFRYYTGRTIANAEGKETERPPFYQ